MRLGYTFPEDFPKSAEDLIRKLVVTEPDDRLSSKNYKDLKSHEFFESIDWSVDLSQMTPP